MPIIWESFKIKLTFLSQNLMRLVSMLQIIPLTLFIIPLTTLNSSFSIQRSYIGNQ